MKYHLWTIHQCVENYKRYMIYGHGLEWIAKRAWANESDKISSMYLARRQVVKNVDVRSYLVHEARQHNRLAIAARMIRDSMLADIAKREEE
jgi:hypothetical protein